MSFGLGALVRASMPGAIILGNAFAAAFAGVAQCWNRAATFFRVARSLATAGPHAPADSTADPHYYDSLLPSEPKRYPPLPPVAGLERVASGEADLAFRLARQAASTVIVNYCPAHRVDPSAVAQRDQHAKQHGTVKARFKIHADLPEPFQAGVFQPGAEYDCLLRLSNVTDPPRDDRLPNSRGLAIKLFEVKGDFIWRTLGAEAPDQAPEQDFLMTNNPVFIARNAAEYESVIRWSMPTGSIWRFLALRGRFGLFLARHPRLFFLMMLSAFRPVSNPLDASYYSMTAYRLGTRRVVRYIVRPKAPGKWRWRCSPDYMQELMAERLRPGCAPVVLNFLVQLRARPSVRYVEDPSLSWNSPADITVPVAEIEIPGQDFTDPARLCQAENLSFTPWHCLEAHRPLGGLNRLRLQVYRASRSVRHRLNGVD